MIKVALFMKSIKISVAAMCLLFAVQSCSPVREKIVSQRQRINEEKIVEGKKMKIGLWVEILDSTIQVANYANGLKQGKVKHLYKNGEYSIANYKDDIHQGWERFYRKDGFVYLEILYEQGDVVQRKSFTPSF
jgi:antitoxin component YwqK of YwqJK toxin-antitoxin module